MKHGYISNISKSKKSHNETNSDPMRWQVEHIAFFFEIYIESWFESSHITQFSKFTTLLIDHFFYESGYIYHR